MRPGIGGKTLLLATAVAVVCVTATLATPALGASAAVPQCSTSQLQLEFVDMQAATGYRFVDFAWGNVGTTRCSLRGYPAGVLLNQHGQAIDSAVATVTRWPLSPLRTVLISPGQRAFFTFHWVVAGFCPGHKFTFYGLRVARPHAASGDSWPRGKTLACDRSAMVSAVRPDLFPF